jgi:hypothetical protein
LKQVPVTFEIGWPPQGRTIRGVQKSAAKFESTTPNAGSILRSIRESRAQLPDDEPSVILIKVPEHWLPLIVENLP